MNYYSNPTANTAIANVDRELRVMKKKALRLKELRRKGKLSREEEAAARRQFIGIYRRLLEEVLADQEPGGEAAPPPSLNCTTAEYEVFSK